MLVDENLIYENWQIAGDAVSYYTRNQKTTEAHFEELKSRRSKLRTLYEDIRLLNKSVISKRSKYKKEMYYSTDGR